MQIDFIEVSNYRKLLAARIDISETQTLFVGANNSGKTSAMVALRQFLKDRGGFTTKDVTASNWAKLEALAASWMTLGEEEAPNAEAFNRLMPTLDVWITAADHELHHVAHLIPSLDWTSGQLGVRLRLEVLNFEALVADFREAKSAADAHIKKYAKGNVAPAKDFSLWPKSFADYLDRRFPQKLGAYLLDPAKVTAPSTVHRAQPQDLSPNPVPLDRDPFAGLIHMREIAAQRGFADATDAARADGEEKESASPSGSRNRLSSQLQAYYRRHLDPDKDPTEEDVSALGAFHTAQSTFDERLEKGFSAAKAELESLGYPGMSNPKLSISTRIKATDGLNHPSAVQYNIGGDGDAIRFVISLLGDGAYTIDGETAQIGSTIEAGQTLIWTPAILDSGETAALLVRADDGVSLSQNTAIINVNVAAAPNPFATAPGASVVGVDNTDGRWIVTVSGDGSLALAKVDEDIEVELLATPKIDEFDPVEATQQAIEQITPADVFGRFLGGGE